MSEFLDLHGRTSKVLRALADAAMRRHGLHVGQNYLLAVLWERDGSTPGQVAAGVNAPPLPEPPVQSASASGATPSAAAQTPPANQRQVKVMVAPVEGAPSDGNR